MSLPDPKNGQKPASTVPNNKIPGKTPGRGPNDTQPAAEKREPGKPGTATPGEKHENGKPGKPGEKQKTGGHAIGQKASGRRMEFLPAPVREPTGAPVAL
jgi:hypothetical protein